MIEKTLLIEDEGGTAILVTLSSKGELNFASAADTTFRELMENGTYPNLYWYRCSGDGVHAAANGTPKYKFDHQSIFPDRGYNAERVRGFVERLNGVPA